MDYKPNDILTVQQVAAIKKVDATSVRRAIQNDNLKAQKTSKVYLIRYKDVAAWEPQRRGRKRKDE